MTEDEKFVGCVLEALNRFQSTKQPTEPPQKPPTQNDIRTARPAVSNAKQLMFHNRALREVACPECKTEVTWEANFDALGTTYSAECCGNIFYITPHTVMVSIDKQEPIVEPVVAEAPAS